MEQMDRTEQAVGLRLFPQQPRGEGCVDRAGGSRKHGHSLPSALPHLPWSQPLPGQPLFPWVWTGDPVWSK